MFGILKKVIACLFLPFVMQTSNSIAYEITPTFKIGIKTTFDPYNIQIHKLIAERQVLSRRWECSMDKFPSIMGWSCNRNEKGVFCNADYGCTKNRWKKRDTFIKAIEFLLAEKIKKKGYYLQLNEVAYTFKHRRYTAKTNYHPPSSSLLASSHHNRGSIRKLKNELKRDLKKELKKLNRKKIIRSIASTPSLAGAGVLDFNLGFSWVYDKYGGNIKTSYLGWVPKYKVNNTYTVGMDVGMKVLKNKPTDNYYTAIDILASNYIFLGGYTMLDKRIYFKLSLGLQRWVGEKMARQTHHLMGIGVGLDTNRIIRYLFFQFLSSGGPSEDKELRVGMGISY